MEGFLAVRVRLKIPFRAACIDPLLYSVLFSFQRTRHSVRIERFWALLELKLCVR